jgi:hypothetical protein
MPLRYLRLAGLTDSGQDPDARSIECDHHTVDTVLRPLTGRIKVYVSEIDKCWRG